MREAGIAEEQYADNVRTRSGLPRQVLTASTRRVGHRVWWSGDRQVARTQALRRFVGPLAGPLAERTGCSGETATPLPRPFGPASIVGFGGLAAGSATAPLRRQLQHPIVVIECDV